MIVTLRQDPNNILVYTDGSKREDNIGGAGHIDIPGQDPIELLFPLGREHEVYDAEIHAIHKTIEKCAKLCRQRQMRNKTFWVFSDNQAAVMRMATFKASTGQTASLEVQQACKTISEYDCRISLQWVPGHTEVEGNEEADRLAKAATEIPQPSLYMTTVTYLRRIARACSQIEWAKEWRSLNNTGRSYARAWKRKPDAIFEGNNRKTISLITQLRTAHGYFRAYLAPLPNNQIETESCFCDEEALQTPHHLLLRCDRYREQRRGLLKAINQRNPKWATASVMHNAGIHDELLDFLNATQIGTRMWSTKNNEGRSSTPHPGRRDWGVEEEDEGEEEHGDAE
jgi:ribonuclease HI